MGQEVAQQRTSRLKRYRSALLISLVFLFVFVATSELTAALVHWLNIASFFSDQNTFLFAGQVAIYALMALVLVALTRLVLKQKSLKVIFGFKEPRRYWYFALVPVLFIGYLLFSQLVSAAITHFVPVFNATQSQNVGFTFTNATDRIVAGVMLILIVPFFEETVFRGWLFGQVRRHVGFWGSAVIVSLIFAYLHGQWNVGVDVFFLSMVLCWLRQKTGSIWVGVSLHALKNLIAFIVIIYAGIGN